MNDKKTINVSTIGHIDHGKTTLTSAITKVASQMYGSEYKAYDQIDFTKEEKERGITINAAHVCYNTKDRFCIHVDCPGHADYVKNMIVGSSEIDIAILVVAVTDGIMPQTREHVLLISRIGVPSLVVFLNKMDALDVNSEDDMMLAELVESDIKEFVAKYGYKDVTVIRGSAFKAANGEKGEYAADAIVKLLDQVNTMTVKDRDEGGAFLMQIEDKCTITGRGTVVTGRVIQGTVSKGQEVEVAGGKKPFKTVVVSIEMFRKSVDVAKPGADVGVLLRGIEKDQVSRGLMIAKPGFVKFAKKIKCELYILTTEEGGRNSGFSVKYSPQFYMRSLDVTGTFTAISSATTSEQIDIALPGESIIAEVMFKRVVPLDSDVKLVLRESGKTIAGGRVSSILES